MRKTLIRRCANRVLNLLARFSPGAETLRPMLHRARGVKIGRGVFIGDDVYIDGEYPESIEIGDRVQISVRAVILAHTRGAGRVVVEKEAFVGPHAVIVCSAGRALRIGEGAVISAGCVVTKNVPPHVFLAASDSRVAGYAKVPLTTAKTMEEFWSGLKPLSTSTRKPLGGAAGGDWEKETRVSGQQSGNLSSD